MLIQVGDAGNICGIRVIVINKRCRLAAVLVMLLLPLPPPRSFTILEKVQRKTPFLMIYIKNSTNER